MSQSRRGRMTVSIDLSGKNCGGGLFFSRSEWSKNYTYHWSMHAHHPFSSAHLSGRRSKAKVAMANGATKFAALRLLQQVLNVMCGRILLSPRKETREGDGQTENNIQTLSDNNSCTSLALFCTYCNSGYIVKSSIIAIMPTYTNF